jgi:hypothetical protein
VSKRNRERPWAETGQSGSATLIAPRYHGTIQGFLESGHEILLGIDSNVKAATLLGEALRIQDALLTGPRIGLVAKTDDVDGESLGGIVELFRQVTR